ncbi:MAG: hypothetical protein IT379_21475 [Deltaproteobacteria bacterium]|nr:hypothetical protein [Deltaproteobacteria bacterium]
MQDPHWRYLLSLDIDAIDGPVLIDALDDEPCLIRDRIGKRELERRIRDGLLDFDATSLDRLDGFERDIGTFSVYLSTYVVGREIEVRPTLGAPLLRGWKIVGRQGEVVRLALDLGWNARDESILDADEDVGDVAARWAELPEWMQNAMRAKHPRLRVL